MKSASWELPAMAYWEAGLGKADTSSQKAFWSWGLEECSD